MSLQYLLLTPYLEPEQREIREIASELVFVHACAVVTNVDNPRTVSGNQPIIALEQSFNDVTCPMKQPNMMVSL